MGDSSRPPDFPSDPGDLEWLEEKLRPFDAAWERALKGGPRPRIEDYLVPVGDHRRRCLLRDLLLSDVQYRIRAGDRPVTTDYESRFPEHRDLIESALRVAGISSQAAEPVTPKADLEMTCTFVSMGTDAGSPVPIQLSEQEQDELRQLFRPGVALQERYVIKGELGGGQMGQVYLAHDTRLQRPVAIKVIQPRLMERLASGSSPSHPRGA